jgi:NADH dehydrogenase [ubiquinone] 1 alpha subcomplex assembly factor 6
MTVTDESGTLRNDAMSTLAASLRRHDRDRFLTTLFAPSDRRAALVALYGFNFEVAKIREIVHEPLLGQIRLQWWREAIDEIYRGATTRKHEVVQPLAEAIRRFALTRYHFDRLIDGRTADLDDVPPRDLAAFETYAGETSGRLVFLALEILDATEPAAIEAGRHVGIAWALVGLIRALPVQLRMRRVTLPAALMQEHGVDEAQLLALKPSPALAAVVERIAGAARQHLAQAGALRHTVPRRATAALLPATLARAHLRRIETAGNDPFDPSLAPTDNLAAWRLAIAALRRRP